MEGEFASEELAATLCEAEAVLISAAQVGLEIAHENCSLGEHLMVGGRCNVLLKSRGKNHSEKVGKAFLKALHSVALVRRLMSAAEAGALPRPAVTRRTALTYVRDPATVTAARAQPELRMLPYRPPEVDLVTPPASPARQMLVLANRSCQTPAMWALTAGPREALMAPVAEMAAPHGVFVQQARAATAKFGQQLQHQCLDVLNTALKYVSLVTWAFAALGSFMLSVLPLLFGLMFLAVIVLILCRPQLLVILTTKLAFAIPSYLSYAFQAMLQEAGRQLEQFVGGFSLLPGAQAATAPTSVSYHTEAAFALVESISSTSTTTMLASAVQPAVMDETPIFLIEDGNENSSIPPSTPVTVLMASAAFATAALGKVGMGR